MRVAHLHNVRLEAANGIYKAVAGLAMHLPTAGVDVEAWHLDVKAKSIVERKVGTTTIYDLPSYSRGASALRGLPAETRAFIDRRQREIDIVHIHSVFLPNNVSVARRLTTVPYVVSPHGGYGEPVLRGSNRIGKAVWLAISERPMLQRAAFIHTVSEAERDEIKARWPELNVRFVPNGVDLPDEPTDALPQTRDFIFLGRLAVDHKGLDRMVRGFAHYVRSLPAGTKPVRLILAGPDHRGGRAALEQLTADERIGEFVQFAGPVFGPEKLALLNNAMAMVHLSRWEGMPIAILEALSMSMPALLTPETNVGAMVERYSAGVVVQDGDDAAAVAKAFATMAQLADGPLAAMRAAARQLIQDNFTWPIIASQQAALYREACGQFKVAGRAAVGVGGTV
ncbi:MAG TPA: glycosyltransferase family 4 protein [Tepidisphaeraceae bacterium]|jgi:glycosyltransferase involved in cell wall biosynthesis|nr:glycosyltransferase family 4 protein [Tepidisphaeraceae bacterium]